MLHVLITWAIEGEMKEIDYSWGEFENKAKNRDGWRSLVEALCATWHEEEEEEEEEDYDDDDDVVDDDVDDVDVVDDDDVVADYDDDDSYDTMNTRLTK